MTFLALLNADNFSLSKVASTHGGEYAGACPWCGGNDRFRVWPEDRGGRYWCRACDKRGDAIQYLRDYRNLSFAEACKTLGRDPGTRPTGQRPAPTVWTPREHSIPSLAWATKAGTFLIWAQKSLWGDDGNEARGFLHGKGLNDQTICAAGLGWNPKDYFRSRESWGLPSQQKEGGTFRRLWLPAGIVIPHFGDACFPIRLRIRRTEGEPRYYLTPGSDPGPMILNPDRAATVILESELDALLLQQEVGDLVSAIALGSVSSKPDRITHEALKATAVILIALDTDEAGGKASWQFWNITYGKKARRWPCINGKDPSAAWGNGLDLRAWIIAGLFGDETKYERFCIMTVDGGLTDAEAMKELL